MTHTYELVVNISEQKTYLMQQGKILKSYLVSTAENGIGQQEGSEMTPLGCHEICEKIGDGCAPNTIFQYRQPTGELYNAHIGFTQKRDWIITRILRLKGLEPGFNQGSTVDTYQRCIYFHGAPDESPMGVPASRGCIRMHNWDIIDLFERVTVGTKVLIIK